MQGLLPQGPPRGSESARRLRAGPWEVERRELRLVDTSRPTPANREFPGAPTRTLQTSLWLPKDAPGVRPLVIYSHGFLSQRKEGAYLARHLASHGYVVASADHPLSHADAPGGPTFRDVASRPGDASFLIDALLGRAPSDWTAPAGPVSARVDPDRIAAVGLSMGGFTSTLVAYHPTLRDPRVRAAVSIAGPLFPFSAGFFQTARVPFLVIASREDVFVDFDTNAGRVAERAPGTLLLTLKGASHAGFADIAAGILRFWPNPDSLGCWYLDRRVDLQRDLEEPIDGLGGAENGIDLRATVPLPCRPGPRGPAMRPRRQHAITTLAVRAFLDAQLALDAERRAAAQRYLGGGIALELPEVELSETAGGLRATASSSPVRRRAPGPRPAPGASR